MLHNKHISCKEYSEDNMWNKYGILYSANKGISVGNGWDHHSYNLKYTKVYIV